MAKVEIYTSPLCGYCSAAKRLLTKKGAKFEETDIARERGKRDEMMKRAGGLTSVPQIFINGQHVGGSDELHELDFDGALDPMLAQ
ncbi:MAG: glutaredoxin 3 [Rhodobacteraceae bacterium]|nr:glutaredoxin 3 [Paracoccaceae bacterium]